MTSPITARPDRLLYRIEINAPQHAVWRAITDPEWTMKYFHNTAVHSTWKLGDRVTYDLPTGETAISGVLLEYDSPRRFVMTARFHFDNIPLDEPESRVTWEVTPSDSGRGSVLTLTHDRIRESRITLMSVRGGWMGIVEGLAKTLDPSSVATVEHSAE